CTIGRCCGLRAVQATGVHAEKDVLARLGKRRELNKDLAQPLSHDLAVLKGFIQTGPPPLEQRRERQLRKAVGQRFTAQGVHRVKQCVACSLETPIDRVTKFVQRVTVHLENAPPCFLVYWNITPSG